MTVYIQQAAGRCNEGPKSSNVPLTGRMIYSGQMIHLNHCRRSRNYCRKVYLLCKIPRKLPVRLRRSREGLSDGERRRLWGPKAAGLICILPGNCQQHLILGGPRDKVHPGHIDLRRAPPHIIKHGTVKLCMGWSSTAKTSTNIVVVHMLRALQ